MSTRSKKSHRFDNVRRIFSGLSLSQEPDAQLFDALQAAVARCGPRHFTDVILMFLSDTRRKGQHTLPIFLERAGFVIKLNEYFKNENNHVGKLVAYFNFFGADSYQHFGSAINETISTLISWRGYEALGPLVQAFAAFHAQKIITEQIC
jgi:hypothetical protein